MEIMYTAFAFVVSLCLSVLAWKTRSTRSTSLNLPPGPRKLPFIGNLHLLALSSMLPHHILKNLSMKYGLVMHLQLGEISTVVISSAESAKEVMKTHDLAFASRPVILASEILFYGRKDIAFCPYGDYWRQMRKVSVLKLLSAKRVRSFRGIREIVFLNLCRWVASNAGSPISLTERLISTSYDAISRSLLGEKCKEHETFICIFKEAIEALGGFCLADMYPSIKLLHYFSGLKGRLEKVHREFDWILEDILQQRLTTDVNVDESKKKEDLLDVLLKLKEDDADLQLTMDNIKAMILVFFVAGSETSPTVVDWAMSEMLKNPTVMKRAQEEVRRIFDGKTGRVDESYLDELNYLKLVIKETLRLHPPGPLLLPRECRESTEILGYRIPVKSRVLINAWALGRDPKYWKDAESFKPERFLNKNVDYKGNDFEFVLFGAGRRICPGMLYALTNSEAQLALLLYHFDWSLPEGMKPEDIDMTETFGLTATRKNELYVIPTIMRPLPID